MSTNPMDVEYDKCMATGLYSSDNCARLDRCVWEANVGVNTLCGTDKDGNIVCISDTQPYFNTVTEAGCYAEISQNDPLTYPGFNNNTTDDDPPVSTLPPPQVDPCSIYYDCKTSSRCVLL